MYKALMEIMEPKLRVKRIQEAVDLLRDDPTFCIQCHAGFSRLVRTGARHVRLQKKLCPVYIGK